MDRVASKGGVRQDADGQMCPTIPNPINCTLEMFKTSCDWGRKAKDASTSTTFFRFSGPGFGAHTVALQKPTCLYTVSEMIENLIMI
jgi:hypothetical protein